MNATPLLVSYLNARYDIVYAADASLRVGRCAAPLERRHPDVRIFALLTAYNPGSERRARRANERAAGELDRLLEAAQVSCVAALNSDADGAWREPSRVVFDAPPGLVDAAAQRFGQCATLAWTRGRAVRLRLYRPEWRDAVEAAGVDTRFIDWVASAPA